LAVSDSKIPVALTIAGSDSGGGAGVQADLKTFAAAGVHGASCLTAITAQNTLKVASIHNIPTNIIEDQIRVVAEDLGVNAAKTGMLHTPEVIEKVAELVTEFGFPLVVDPVMVAKSGAPLLREDSVEILKHKLLPMATLVTPNIPEAEKLSGIAISDERDMRKAATRILDLGCRGVVVKGGHLTGEAVDLLLWDGATHTFRRPRIEVSHDHGTGCSFSAAITAEIAKGSPVVEAVSRAKELVYLAVKFGFAVGHGHGPVNPVAGLHLKAEKISVIEKLMEAYAELQEIEPRRVVPEVGMNIAYALPKPDCRSEVAAFASRIISDGARYLLPACPMFGKSSHLASYLVGVGSKFPHIRAAVNIRFDDRTLREAEKASFRISSYDRRSEPEDIKRIEGASIPWGVSQALSRSVDCPDIIYHTGDVGKEPMIVVLARDPVEAVRKIRRIVESGAWAREPIETRTDRCPKISHT
jgi:hydroxymethylpyrimidine/phosphomethylpyrimidine kinase